MNKQYAKNKKAYHDYTMVESFEAGLSLTGPEVKSVRASTINLLGSFVSVEGKQVLLKQCHISRPDHIGNKPFEELRVRALLLNKSEIAKIHKAVKEKGTTIIPLAIFQRDGTKKIKMTIAIAKGKDNKDKRNTLKEKTQKMDMDRELKKY